MINEIFGENYTGEEEIEFTPNEHFLDQQDGSDQERITDTNFTVFGKTKKKYHIECESSYPDGRITIRLFEYDAQIALDEGRMLKRGKLTTEEIAGLSVGEVEKIAEDAGLSVGQTERSAEFDTV